MRQLLAESIVFAVVALAVVGLSMLTGNEPAHTAAWTALFFAVAALLDRGGA